MRIGFDCRTVTAAKTGDRSYALGLTRALSRVDPSNEYLLYTWEPTTLTAMPGGRAHPIVLSASPRWTWTPIRFPLDLKRRAADVAHVQYVIPPWSPCPIVTAIHDCSFRRFPQLFPLKHRVLLNLLIPFAVRRAGAVVTGSEATRRDLIELYRADPAKLFVTPYAVDESFRPMGREAARSRVEAKLGITTPYVLSLCHMHPRKNLPRLVRAYNRIAGNVKERLVLAGKIGWHNQELASAIKASPEGKEPIVTGYVNDEDLPALYAAAELFVYPSLFEGFGLPPLEAMACGTPVLTSNTSSLPEVVGDAGQTVDPLDEIALATRMADLLSRPDRLAALSAAGLERAKHFSWDRAARQTIRVYEAVANRGAGGGSL